MPIKYFICFLCTLFVSLSSYATCVGLGCSCSVSTAAFNFGTYDPLSSINDNTTGTVSVTCSALVINAIVNYNIELSPGSSGNYTARTLVDGINDLTYNFYIDASRSIIWGDGSSGTSLINDGYLISLLAPVTRNYTIYGQIPAEQAVTPGMYLDTVVATVVF
ncbi:MAG: hypothetical protein CMF49_07375 [Legionellales bacterium]|nr:hypothetical protein [Legionellales bacterium]|tara:strand:- start:351 stop:839 length:489 start_codon:yes stop_codon:yes gene_type:complete